MDFPSSLKKSFKSRNSYRRRGSAGSQSEEELRYEQQPILSDHNRRSTSPEDSSPMSSQQPEVILKIDDPTILNRNRSNNITRDSSLEFWKHDATKHMQEDPPSRLIGQFLNKQRANGGDITLDVDLEMDELRVSPRSFQAQRLSFDNPDRNDPSFARNSKEQRVSFQSTSPNVIDIVHDERENARRNNDSSSDECENRRVHNRRRSSNIMDTQNVGGNNVNGNDGQVLRCTSVRKRVSNLGRLKTQSRLADPPEVPERRSGMIKASPMRSGMLGRASGMLGKPGEEEEDDPFFDEDLPNEYTKNKCGVLVLAEWISLVSIVTALVCTLAISKWKKKKLRGLSLWKWEVLILVLICGRLVSGWGVRLVVFFIERNFFMRKRILYFVYGVRRAVQNCIWLGLVLIAWHSMFDRKVEGNNRFLRYVNKFMVCLLVGTLLWLVKTLMVKVLASSFHVSTFFDRIQESLFNQYVIKTLSGPPLIEIQNHQDEEDRTMAEVWRLQNAGATLPPELRASGFQPTKSGKYVGSGGGGGLPPKPPLPKPLSFKVSGQLAKNEEDQGISIDQLHKLNPKNVSAWNMKRLMKVVKNGLLTTLDEQVLDSAQGDEDATQIKSECEAKCAARKIFRSVAKPGAKFIYLDDLMRFLAEDEAVKTLHLVEGCNESERISKASLKNWVVNSFVERKALALTLNDTKTAVNKLHRMVNVIVGVIILVICLVILDIVSGKFLLYISSQVVVVAFIFGNTLKTIFEAVIFVFVMHPFDVGDRCEVDGVQLVVEEMNILTTVFLRFDNQKIFYPNVTLATKPISNYYRSPDMGDSVDFAVHISTPAEKIGVMKQRIISYIEKKSDHWYPEPSVVLMNLEELNRLKLSVWMRHRMNHQNMGEKWKRRALLVEEMVEIFKELDIEYRLYPLDINIRAMPPARASQPPWPAN
nr:mechanosensitive ion channel protein A042019 [Torenia fournieri]